MAAKIRKIPYIFEVHSDIYPLGFFKFLIPLYKRTGWRWVMQHADIVIFLSQDQERNLKDEYSLKRTIVIPNGVDKKFYVRRKTISKQRPAHILSVGRLSKEKNLNLLIEAFSQIKQSATLDIIGEGPDRARLQKLIKYKHLESSVNLYGKLVGDSLIEKYRNADIYVMTSFSEGLSLSMLEAMAASLPVVAFDAPGVTEHIGRIGVVINSHEPGALSLALDKLLSDKQGLSVLSEKSSTYAASFSWPSVINRLDRLYEKVYKRQL
jgi:rhamnosyl/mannosyltransferase